MAEPYEDHRMTRPNNGPVEPEDLMAATENLPGYIESLCGVSYGAGGNYVLSSGYDDTSLTDLMDTLTAEALEPIEKKACQAHAINVKYVHSEKSVRAKLNAFDYVNHVNNLAGRMIMFSEAIASARREENDPEDVAGSFSASGLVDVAFENIARPNGTTNERYLFRLMEVLKKAETDLLVLYSLFDRLQRLRGQGIQHVCECDFVIIG